MYAEGLPWPRDNIDSQSDGLHLGIKDSHLKNCEVYIILYSIIKTYSIV